MRKQRTGPAAGSAPRIRIALADDHTLVRDGFRAILDSEPAFLLVAEAADGLETLKMIETCDSDILLLDLRIPRLHGIEVLRQLKGREKPRVVVVSMHSDESFLVEALKHGVAGYVLKTSSRDELFAAIRTAAGGGQYICDELRSRAVQASLQTAAGRNRAQQLTKREQMVLHLAAEGRSSAQIGQALSISIRTAEAHRANFMRKLGLKSQTDLVLYSVRNGIVSP